MLLGQNGRSIATQYTNDDKWVKSVPKLCVILIKY